MEGDHSQRMPTNFSQHFPAFLRNFHNALSSSCMLVNGTVVINNLIVASRTSK